MRGPLTYAVLGTVLAALTALLCYLVWRGQSSDAIGVALALVATLVNLVVGPRLRHCGPKWCFRTRGGGLP